MAVVEQHPPVRPVPFLDLAPIHRGLKEPLLEDIAGLIDSGAFANGPQIAAFEDAYARYCGTAHCVGVASGLDALRLGLLAAGLEAGGEVIVPAHTFVATLEAVTQARGVPILCDIREDDYGLDAEAAASVVGPGTRALVPVHLYGQMADMRRLAALAARHDLTVVEDACQAHGASRDGLTPGAAAEAAAFSFYPGKNLGAMGDAGALVTNVAPLATHVRTLRQHGQAAKYEHHVEGWTSRLDTIQAIVLLHKLPLLDAWNDERRRIARLYGGALAGVGDLILPAVPEGSHPVWHLYVIRTPRRAALAAHLAARGVATGRHYPDPVHLTQAYAHLGHRRGAFPVAERLAGEGLSLPVYPGMPLAEVESVAEGIRDFYRRG